MKVMVHQSLFGFVRLGTAVVLAAIFAAVSIWQFGSASAPRAAAIIPAPASIPAPSPSDLPAPSPLPESFSLPPARWIGQTYNNCGPATVAELLQYFGFEIDQSVTKAALRTGSDDKNVTLAEISGYLRSEFALESRVFVNGDLPTLKRLLSAGIPVIVEDWLHPNEDIGHVLLLRGYDDRRGALLSDDVYLGPNHAYPYAEFEREQWQPFNRIYLPVYRPQQEETVRTIVGEDWNETAMYTRALAAARREIESQPDNAYSWLNLGADALALGDEETARAAFARSRSLGWPARLLWYRSEPLVFLDPPDTLE